VTYPEGNQVAWHYRLHPPRPRVLATVVVALLIGAAGYRNAENTRHAHHATDQATAQRLQQCLGIIASHEEPGSKPFEPTVDIAALTGQQQDDCGVQQLASQASTDLSGGYGAKHSSLSIQFNVDSIKQARLSALQATHDSETGTAIVDTAAGLAIGGIMGGIFIEIIGGAMVDRRKLQEQRAS